jgi:sirohydrochlorin ferrochelatase
MTDDALLLIGRDTTPEARDVYETHADRLRRRDTADAVHVATYEHEPRRELRERVGTVGAARTYAVPMCMAHTNETTEALPAAFDAIDGEVQYCEPVGRSPSVTRAIIDRATERSAADAVTSLVLVGFGNTAGAYHRDVTEYHAAHARERADYGDVLACYLTQNPTVECVRYSVGTESAVAVPLFVAPSTASETRIPSKLELDRGGLAYADPLGTHPAVTDAVQDRLETGRVLAESTAGQPSFEETLTETARPLATDGEG